MTRIALLAPTYWPEVRRGSERFIRELADGLLDRGHRVRLITSHAGPPSRAVESGLQVLRLPRPPQGRLRRRMFEPHLAHAPLSHLALVRGDDDLAHPTYPTDAAVAVRARRRTGAPVVFSYMGVPHRRALANRRRRVELTVEGARGADALVVLTRAAADGFVRWLGITPDAVIPAPVDLTRFVPGPRAERPTILCAADAAEPRKRVGLLVEAMALVRRERPDAVLVLDRPRDPVLARALQGPGVVLEDLTADLPAATASAWVAALPSTGEAFGLVLAEALACGTPAVGAREGAVPEVIDRPEVGRLFEEPTPRAVADALLEALELGRDPATAAACRERAEAFSRDRVTSAYEDVYRSVT